MIDESRTLEIYGYTSDSLSNASCKRVVAVCEDCGRYRDVRFRQYRELCRSCCQKGCYRSEETKKRNSDAARNQVCSDETRQKMSMSAKGRRFSDEHKRRIKENHVGFSGRKHSNETKRKIGMKSRMVHRTDEWKANLSKSGIGRKLSNAIKKKISASHQGIAYDMWESYACKKRYCPKFNEFCKESNREKYGRRCFICGLPESDNLDKNGKKKKLSVHHVDMDKNQGCDGVRWKLVPVCMKHHTHNDLWVARFTYLLNNVWHD